MLSFLVLLTMLFMASSVTSSPVDVIQDHVHGALVGSVLGDTFARGISLLDTKDEALHVYGDTGLTTMEQFTQLDWGTENQTALYSGNSVLALMTLKHLMYARKRNQSRHVVVENIARSMIDMYGVRNKQLDTLFDLRYHTMENRQAGEQLAQMLKHKKQEDWWLKDFKQEDSEESRDAGSLMRAWPIGLIFSENISNVKILSDYQAQLTHHNPTVRAASVALAVGIAYAVQGIPVDLIVNQMVRAAAEYDRAELAYKPHAHKSYQRRTYNPDAIAQDHMLTSDMIRYAADMAEKGFTPDQILGTTNKRQENNRSFRGYLLGYQADEAVAAAVYLFVRNAKNLPRAVIEASNAFGNTKLIGSLAGALVGAHTGYTSFYNHPAFALEKLEKYADLKEMSLDMTGVIRVSLEKQEQERNPEKYQWCSKRCKVVLGLGLVALGGYALYKYLK